MPQKATKAGSLWPGLRERRYQNATRANLGPTGTSQSRESVGLSGSNWRRRLTRCQGDEQLEKGSLGIAVAYGSGDGGKPLLRVSEPLVLDDLVVVERDADYQCAEEGSWESQSVSQPASYFPSMVSDGSSAKGGRGRSWAGSVQYARMVCSQLIQTPLKEKSTPPSLSLYLDVAIVEGAPITGA